MWQAVCPSTSSLNLPCAHLLVHIARQATDESFVYFDNLAASAKFHEGAALHGKPDTVHHEPCGFLSDTDSASHFIGTDTVFAIGNHPNGSKPLVQRDRRILKDSPDLDTELLAWMLRLALPHASGRDESNILTPASGALDAIGPAPRHYEVQAVLRIGEIGDGLLKCLWLVHGVPHKPNISKMALQSQVYYCHNLDTVAFLDFEAAEEAALSFALAQREIVEHVAT